MAVEGDHLERRLPVNTYGEDEALMQMLWERSCPVHGSRLVPYSTVIHLFQLIYPDVNWSVKFLCSRAMLALRRCRPVPHVVLHHLSRTEFSLFFAAFHTLLIIAHYMQVNDPPSAYSDVVASVPRVLSNYPYLQPLFDALGVDVGATALPAGALADSVALYVIVALDRGPPIPPLDPERPDFSLSTPLPDLSELDAAALAGGAGAGAHPLSFDSPENRKSWRSGSRRMGPKTRHSVSSSAPPAPTPNVVGASRRPGESDLSSDPRGGGDAEGRGRGGSHDEGHARPSTEVELLAMALEGEVEPRRGTNASRLRGGGEGSVVRSVSGMEDDEGDGVGGRHGSGAGTPRGHKARGVRGLVGDAAKGDRSGLAGDSPTRAAGVSAGDGGASAQRGRAPPKADTPVKTPTVDDVVGVRGGGEVGKPADAISTGVDAMVPTPSRNVVEDEAAEFASVGSAASPSHASTASALPRPHLYATGPAIPPAPEVAAPPLAVMDAASQASVAAVSAAIGRAAATASALEDESGLADASAVRLQILNVALSTYGERSPHVSAARMQLASLLVGMAAHLADIDMLSADVSDAAVASLCSPGGGLRSPVTPAGGGGAAVQRARAIHVKLLKEDIAQVRTRSADALLLCVARLVSDDGAADEESSEAPPFTPAYAVGGKGDIGSVIDTAVRFVTGQAGDSMTPRAEVRVQLLAECARVGAALSLLRGQLEDANAHARNGLLLLLQCRDLRALPAMYLNVAAVFAAQGDPHAALSHAQLCLRVLDSVAGDIVATPSFHPEAVRMYVDPTAPDGTPPAIDVFATLAAVMSSSKAADKEGGESAAGVSAAHDRSAVVGVDAGKQSLTRSSDARAAVSAALGAMRAAVPAGLSAAQYVAVLRGMAHHAVGEAESAFERVNAARQHLNTSLRILREANAPPSIVRCVAASLARLEGPPGEKAARAAQKAAAARVEYRRQLAARGKAAALRPHAAADLHPRAANVPSPGAAGGPQRGGAHSMPLSPMEPDVYGEDGHLLERPPSPSDLRAILPPAIKSPGAPGGAGGRVGAKMRLPATRSRVSMLSSIRRAYAAGPL